MPVPLACATVSSDSSCPVLDTSVPVIAVGATTVNNMWIALAGGAIGALLAGVGWALLRLSGIPGDLRSHDLQVRVLNEDLELWVVDSYRDLKRELTGIETGAGNQLYSGAHGRKRAYAKTKALHSWRDRLHQAERELASIEATEVWAHRLWRRLRPAYPSRLELSAPEHVEPIIEEFRRPVTKHGAPGIKPFDPTVFRLEDVLKVVEAHPLEPEVPPWVERISDGGGGYHETVHENPEPETPDLPGLSGPME
jgi:hypothetical protein